MSSLKTRLSDLLKEEKNHPGLMEALEVDQERFYHTFRQLQRFTALLDKVFEKFPEAQPEPIPEAKTETAAEVIPDTSNEEEE